MTSSERFFNHSEANQLASGVQLVASNMVLYSLNQNLWKNAWVVTLACAGVSHLLVQGQIWGAARGMVPTPNVRQMTPQQNQCLQNLLVIGVCGLLNIVMMSQLLNYSDFSDNEKYTLFLGQILTSAINVAFSGASQMINMPFTPPHQL